MAWLRRVVALGGLAIGARLDFFPLAFLAVVLFAVVLFAVLLDNVAEPRALAIFLPPFFFGDFCVIFFLDFFFDDLAMASLLRVLCGSALCLVLHG
ncbi:MAG: hypothetical protein R3C68_13045 [Myxococcota bacterium]